MVARIQRPVGIRGDLKVEVISSDPDRLSDFQAITVRVDDRYYRFDVLSITHIGSRLKVHLAGVDTPELAGLLRGSEIVVEASERPELSEGEYYVDELVGCAVISDDGEELGWLREIEHLGHHDLWIVDGHKGEIIIPAVKEYISQVNIDKHSIIVRGIEGLWDGA